MKRAEVLKAIAVLSATWPMRELSPATVETYANKLIDLDHDALLAAIETLTVSSDFMPSIASLRQTAIELSPDSAIPDADEAYAEVRRMIGKVGWTAYLGEGRKTEWSHPAIASTVEAIGWRNICESENEEALRAHFFKLYGSASARVSKQQAITPAGRELLASLGQIGKALPSG